MIRVILVYLVVIKIECCTLSELMGVLEHPHGFDTDTREGGVVCANMCMCLCVYILGRCLYSCMHAVPGYACVINV